MNTTSRSLVLMNYFPNTPDITQACKYNSEPLISMMNTCHDVAGKRWPNFIAVDFYKRSNGGGAPAAVDKANGQLVCGCSSISACRPNMTFGACNLPEAVAAPTPISSLRSSGNIDSKSVLFGWLFGADQIGDLSYSSLWYHENCLYTDDLVVRLQN
ncbi:PI-PLC X domain-containing protein-like protein [Tanacetum coccineum]